MQKNIENLSMNDWQEIQNIYDEIVNYLGSFHKVKIDESISGGTISMPYDDSAEIVIKTMQFLYDKKLIVEFDWVSWSEGHAIIRSVGSDKFDNISLIDAFKVLTAVVRSDKFNDGAFARFFESDDARLLFKQILSFRPIKT